MFFILGQFCFVGVIHGGACIAGDIGDVGDVGVCGVSGVVGDVIHNCSVLILG